MKVHGGDALTLDHLENAMNDMWRVQESIQIMMMRVALSCHWRILKASVSNVERKGIVRQNTKIPQPPVVEVEQGGQQKPSIQWNM
jgi:hypothetical protein